MLMVCRQCGCRFAVGLHRCPQCTAEDAHPEGEELPVAKLNSEGVTAFEAYADHEGDLDPVEATAEAARAAAGVTVDESSGTEVSAGGEVLEAAPSRPADDARPPADTEVPDKAPAPKPTAKKASAPKKAS